MSSFEFEEVRERGSPSDPSRIDVVLKHSSVNKIRKCHVRFGVSDGVADWDDVRWRRRGDMYKKSEVSSDHLEHVVGLAVDVLHERGYSVASPFDHDQITGQLGESDDE